MEVEVRLFAGLRQRFGAASTTVELPEGATAGDLLAALDLPPRSCAVAINRQYAFAEQRITAHDEVALIPPVSGGAATVTTEPIDVAALRAAVTDPRAGAVVLFEGVTREVDALEYEAYAEMAEPVLARIAEEEAARHGLCRVAVAHRIGTVPRSEPSVVIAASAPHRAEAFAGARAIIDRLKQEAPIWKQEEGEWVAGQLPEAVPESGGGRGRQPPLPDGVPDQLPDERLHGQGRERSDQPPAR